jgi:acetyl esterase/lipase
MTGTVGAKNSKCHGGVSAHPWSRSSDRRRGVCGPAPAGVITIRSAVGVERTAMPSVQGAPQRRWSRRAVLLGAATIPLAAAGCGSDSASRTSTISVTSTVGAAPRAPQRSSYGSDQSQWGELYLPAGDRKPGVIVILHGGFWMSEYTADLGTPLAQDLSSRGHVVWNLEYRRIGNGGGWPQTFQDVAAGIDHLRALNDLDLSKVVAIGHSAGGQLAVWAAGRHAVNELDPGASSKIALTGVVSQAGVLDLAASAAQHLGADAAQQLLGGEPGAVPARYRAASPQENLPNRVPVRCVHSQSDQNVPYTQSADYVSAARKAGGDVSLTTVPGDHFSLITTGTPAWEATVSLATELLG